MYSFKYYSILFFTTIHDVSGISDEVFDFDMIWFWIKSYNQAKVILMLNKRYYVNLLFEEKINKIDENIKFIKVLDQNKNTQFEIKDIENEICNKCDMKRNRILSGLNFSSYKKVTIEINF